MPISQISVTTSTTFLVTTTTTTTKTMTTVQHSNEVQRQGDESGVEVSLCNGRNSFVAKNEFARNFKSARRGALAFDTCAGQFRTKVCSFRVFGLTLWVSNTCSRAHERPGINWLSSSKQFNSARPRAFSARDGWVTLSGGGSQHFYLEEANSDFSIHSGMQCQGTVGQDRYGSILRNFRGSTSTCMQKCRSLKGCAGFIRFVRGRSAGLCFFRGGKLTRFKKDPHNQRHCFEAVSQ